MLVVAVMPVAAAGIHGRAVCGSDEGLAEVSGAFGF